MLKNVAGQKIAVWAWDRVNGVPKDGDAANITAQISKDGGASAASNDVNPTELDAVNHKGAYLFDLTQAESDADLIVFTPSSITGNIVFDPKTIFIYPKEVMRGTDNAALASVCTETRLAELDAANLPTDIANVKTETAAILADTDDIGVAGAGLTAIPWNATWDAQVESECNDALVAQKLDRLVAVADADDVVDNSIIAKLASLGATADWSTFVNTTDSLQAIRDRGDLLQTDSTAIKAKTDNLPSGIAKNVALPFFDFYMLLADGLTAATGKTVTGQIRKDNGSFAAITNAISEVGSGLYAIASGFTQAEMNADKVTLKFTADACKDTIIVIYPT